MTITGTAVRNVLIDQNLQYEHSARIATYGNPGGSGYFQTRPTNGTALVFTFETRILD